MFNLFENIVKLNKKSIHEELFNSCSFYFKRSLEHRVQ